MKGRILMYIETMTLQELTLKMREHGIKTGKSTIAKGIEQGKYPFAICIHCDKQRVFEIYTKKFEEWIREVGQAYAS